MALRALNTIRRSKVPLVQLQRAYCSAGPGGYSFEMSDEQRALVEMAENFTRTEIMPVAAEHDRTGEFPMEIIKKAHALGMMNCHIPEEYGGLGLGAMESVLLSETLAYGCSGISTSIFVPTLATAPILVGASHEQKKKYLGMLTEEPSIASYGVTEPGAGSDVAGLRTTAVKKGSEWVINGSKMWITGSSFAKWFFVLARTDATKGAGAGFTGFIVDADTPGLTVGKKEQMLGQRCSDTRALTFEDVVVPVENQVGAEGYGFKLAMKAFDLTRPDVAAGAVGVAQRAMDEAVAYAKQRKTFGTEIASHQAVAFMLADMRIRGDAARLLVRRAAWEFDQGGNSTTMASVAKAFAADHVMQTTVDAVQVFGGNGYNCEYPVEKLMRDAKIYSIYEGTNQIQRLIISKDVLTK